MSSWRIQGKWVALCAVAVLSPGCCTLFPNLPWCPERGTNLPEVAAFVPAPIARLCPDHVGGDRDFKGHGPEVDATASIELRNGDTEVWVRLSLHEKETRSDYTEALGNWDRKLYTVPVGKVITRVLSAMTSEAHYVDTDHELDRPSVTGGALVSRFEIMGDTGGNDVANCTSDDAYMSVSFNEVRLELQQQP